MTWWAGSSNWRMPDPGEPEHRICKVKACGAVVHVEREKDTGVLIRVCSRCGSNEVVSPDLAAILRKKGK